MLGAGLRTRNNNPHDFYVVFHYIPLYTSWTRKSARIQMIKLSNQKAKKRDIRSQRDNFVRYRIGPSCILKLPERSSPTSVLHSLGQEELACEIIEDNCVYLPSNSKYTSAQPNLLNSNVVNTVL